MEGSNPVAPFFLPFYVFDASSGGVNRRPFFASFKIRALLQTEHVIINFAALEQPAGQTASRSFFRKGSPSETTELGLCRVEVTGSSSAAASEVRVLASEKDNFPSPFPSIHPLPSEHLLITVT